MKILSSFTHLYVVPNLTFFLLQNIKEDILRNVSFYFFHTMEVNGNQNWCPAEERKDHFISVVYYAFVDYVIVLDCTTLCS